MQVVDIVCFDKPLCLNWALWTGCCTAFLHMLDALPILCKLFQPSMVQLERLCFLNCCIIKSVSTNGFIFSGFQATYHSPDLVLMRILQGFLEIISYCKTSSRAAAAAVSKL